MSTIHYYELEISFDTPIISQAIGVLAFGLDSAMQKDTEGYPALSGSLVRGNIRHALEEFRDIINNNNNDLGNKITDWFGQRSQVSKKSKLTAENYQSPRAQVEFDFFWRLNKEDRSKITQQKRTRISIDKDSGTVKEGALQIIEDCFPVGTGEVKLTGQIVAHLSDSECVEFEKWLRKAMDFIPAMASFKGIGFGRICGYQLKKLTSPYASETKTPSLGNNTRFNIQLKPDRPFCLGRPKTPDSNHIISSEIITGNVIKALIARYYDNNHQRLQDDLCFNQLIISHAQPHQQEQSRQSTIIPLSYALLDDKLIDCIDSDISTLKWNEVPSFKPDWKDNDIDKIYSALNIKPITPSHYLSVKTGIEASTGTSKEAELFSLDCIVPDEKTSWNAIVELSNIPKDKQQDVANKLQAIFNKGLHGLGKTKANATVTTQASQQSATLTADQQGYVTIDLLSAAKMLPTGLRLSPINSAEALKNHYQAYWQGIHPDIQLEDYFAQQQLTSTYYHQKAQGKADHYQPDYLTVAGSVFKLKVNSDKALQVLQQCLQTGLPCEGLDRSNEKAWRITPYLPENGYGEIHPHRQLVRKEAGS
ncbi:MAG TPA: hypothetical protein EYH35_00040 [Thiotrichaceae bacterium]|nr:hypothetical protein [Thiotrichaceae bacterium]